jgi:dTDP-glucose 4,6-dehydratase
MDTQTLLVTGGAGFIGVNFIKHMFRQQKDVTIVNLDKLTYAGSSKNVLFLENEKKHLFSKGSIGDRSLVKTLLHQHHPSAVINFAAETHVDRSIHTPEEFVQTNVVDCCSLLSEVTDYWNDLSSTEQEHFRFIQISTDEVYGSLEENSPPSTEESLCCPNSPYAASKAASDHFARAYYKTYGLPIIISRSTNNIGPFQHPEKLIPLVILYALSGKKIPIYGDGQNKRSWIHVEEHCNALRQILAKGEVGEIYNIGSEEELSNNLLVKNICSVLDKRFPNSSVTPHEQLITYIPDRPGHDYRYALNIQKIKKHIGWHCKRHLDEGLKETIDWYLNNINWLQNISNNESFNKWILENYEEQK